MDPSIQQQEHISHAIIGLGIMALLTSIIQIYTTSHYWLSSKPPPPGSSSQAVEQYNNFQIVTTFFFAALIGAWAIGLNFWMTGFGSVSKLQRNNSLIGGIMAANAGLIWTRVRKAPAAGIQDYVSNALWPAYAGMIVGVLI